MKTYKLDSKEAFDACQRYSSTWEPDYEEEIECPECGSFDIEFEKEDYFKCRECGYYQSLEPDYESMLEARAEVYENRMRNKYGDEYV